jgi:hypothetical protein
VTSYAAISDDGTVRLERAFPIPVDQLWAYLTAGRAAPDFAAGWHRHLDTLGYLACGTQPPTHRAPGMAGPAPAPPRPSRRVTTPSVSWRFPGKR